MSSSVCSSASPGLANSSSDVKPVLSAPGTRELRIVLHVSDALGELLAALSAGDGDGRPVVEVIEHDKSEGAAGMLAYLEPIWLRCGLATPTLATAQ